MTNASECKRVNFQFVGDDAAAFQALQAKLGINSRAAMKKTVIRSISIEQKHADYVRENSINLSRFVRKEIEKEITRRNQK